MATKKQKLKSSNHIIRSIIDLMKPGLGLKRWIFLGIFGMTLLAVGIALFILEVYRTAPETWWLPIISFASLRFINRPLRILVFSGLGILVFLIGSYGLNRSVLAPFLRPGRPVVSTITGHRRRERGPKVVAIGGGHGLSMLLRGLKQYTYNLTAIVTVADDGGSSGRLRRSLGILPPGDIRNCLAAMSNDEVLLAQLFQYRFSTDDEALEGHSFGNLFLSALAEITGSFEQAIAESGKVLGVHGKVLPSTLHDVRLIADLLPRNSNQEIRVHGESKIPEISGKVRHVWLEPDNPPAVPQVIHAILNAEMVVVGPGSLYTSIIPNLLVKDVMNAIRATKALKVLVINVATQNGETDNYSVVDHVEAIKNHTEFDLFDIVVANDDYDGELLDGMDWVKFDESLRNDQMYYKTSLVAENEPWHHSERKVSKVLMDLLFERTGPKADSFTE